MRPILILMASACLLTACGGLTPSPVTPRLPPPPDEITRPCHAPVVVTLASGERDWLADRAALMACRARHGAMVDWAASVSGR